MSEPLEEYDFQLALALQTQYDGGDQEDSDDDLPNMSHLFRPTSSKKNDMSSSIVPSTSQHSSTVPTQLNQSNIMDPNLEISDPNPDILTLFLKFNERYFWGKLSMVEVKWSTRMTLCAGICCYEGRGGLCSVRLSQPLLKFRPRKDLVETLLNNKDHDGHGPEFHKHMYRINKLSGSNITVYHNFHDEVQAHRTHWWKCNGICQHRPPYFGIVKRSMNRAPSPRDTWWAHHQQTCGGKYTKIKEPADYKAKKSKRDKPPSMRGTSGNGSRKGVSGTPGSSKGGFPSPTTSILQFLNDSKNINKENAQSNPVLSPFQNSRQNDRAKSFNKSRKKTVKVPTSAVQLTKMLKTEGRQSVCVDAPAFRRKSISSFTKRIVFNDGGDKNVEVNLPKKTLDSKIPERNWNFLKAYESRKRQRNPSGESPRTTATSNAKPCSSHPLTGNTVKDHDSSDDDDIALVDLIYDEPFEKKQKLSLDKQRNNNKSPNFKLQKNVSNSSLCSNKTKEPYLSYSTDSSSMTSVPCVDEIIGASTSKISITNNIDPTINNTDSSEDDDDVTLIDLLDSEPIDKKQKLSLVDEELKNDNKTSTNSKTQHNSGTSQKTKITPTTSSACSTVNGVNDAGVSNISLSKNDVEMASEPILNDCVLPAKTISDKKPSASTSESVEQSSSSVLCPVCNKNIVTDNINAHIDSCLTLIALQRGEI